MERGTKGATHGKKKAILFIFWTAAEKKDCSRILALPSMRAVRRPWCDVLDQFQQELVEYRGG
jgi:hypothetical protein